MQSTRMLHYSSSKVPPPPHLPPPLLRRHLHLGRPSQHQAPWSTWEHLVKEGGGRLAYERVEGRGPTVLYVPGFMSGETRIVSFQAMT